MAESSTYCVRSAELFRNGIIITFADGKCALFSADLLYAALSQAQELTDQEEDEPGTQGDAAVGVPRQ
jgi:hypothetical protein